MNNADDIGNKEHQRNDGVVQKKHAQRILQTGHERKAVRVQNIHYHIPGNKHGSKADTYRGKAQIAHAPQIFWVQQHLMRTNAGAETPYNNEQNKDPEKQQKLMLLQRQQKELHGKRIVKVFKKGNHELPQQFTIKTNYINRKLDFFSRKLTAPPPHRHHTD